MSETGPAETTADDAKGKGGARKKARESAQNIYVFGDSHAKFFFRTGFYTGRHKLRTPLRYQIEGQYIPASSVAGFRPGDRKLNVKETIKEALPNAKKMILAFGQVDLELGYYYRLAVKKEEQTPETYVQWLLGIYRDFVSGLTESDCEIALKGVNLTALTPEPFAVKYVVRIIEGEEREDTPEAKRNLMPFILSEDAQNAMHLDFNAGLSNLADELGLKYFDLVAQTSEKGEGAPRLADHFKPAGFDHHLVDSVSVRRMHYLAAGKVFGLRKGRKGSKGSA